MIVKMLTCKAPTLAYNVAYPMVEKRKKKLDLTKPYIDREL